MLTQHWLPIQTRHHHYSTCKSTHQYLGQYQSLGYKDYNNLYVLLLDVKLTCPLTQHRPLVVHIYKLLYGNHGNDIVCHLDIGQYICMS